jgi:hypothetical protein
MSRQRPFSKRGEGGGEMAQFVDWNVAEATAGVLGKAGPRVTVDEATQVVAELRRLATDAAAHVESYTGMSPVGAPAPVRVVDRRDWAAANIAGLRQVVAPLFLRAAGGKQPNGLTDAVGSRVTGVQAGGVLAYLSGRVLGQYEVFGSDPGQLLLVAPNIVEVERTRSPTARSSRPSRGCAPTSSPRWAPSSTPGAAVTNSPSDCAGPSPTSWRSSAIRRAAGRCWTWCRRRPSASCSTASPR